MTNANVMAAVAVAPVKTTARPVAKGAENGSSAGNFDEALGRLQKEAQGSLESAGKDDTPQGKEAMEGGSGRDGAPQHPLAMAAVLPVGQQLPGEEVQTDITAAAVVDFSGEAPASGDMIKISPDFVGEAMQDVEMALPDKNLRTLLPQSDETAVKSKDFLAMLSGDMLHSQRESARTQLMTDSQVTRPVLDKVQSMPVMDKVQAMPLSARETVDSSTLFPPMEGQSLYKGQESQPMDPLSMALRQTARGTAGVELQAGAGSDESASLFAVRNISAESAAWQTAQQADLSAVVSESVKKTDNWQNLLGEDTVLEVESQPEPLRALHVQGESGQQSGQEQETEQHSRNPAAQVEILKGSQAEEAGAGQVSPLGHQAATVSPQGFQEQLQAVSSAEVVEQPAEPQTDFEVPRQIVEQARLIRNGEETEMVIHLKPEHLGDLTLKVSVSQNGSVTASFHSDNAQVRTIIENSLVQLRQELNNQGIKVDNVEVFAGLPDGQLPQGQGQQAWQQNSKGSFAESKNADDFVDEADELAAAALAQSEGQAIDEGVDYRV